MSALIQNVFDIWFQNVISKQKTEMLIKQPPGAPRFSVGASAVAMATPPLLLDEPHGDASGGGVGA